MNKNLLIKSYLLLINGNLQASKKITDAHEALINMMSIQTEYNKYANLTFANKNENKKKETSTVKSKNETEKEKK
jgi:hypothetical protein